MASREQLESAMRHGDFGLAKEDGFAEALRNRHQPPPPGGGPLSPRLQNLLAGAILVAIVVMATLVALAG